MPPDQRSSSQRRWLVWAIRISVLVVICLGVRGTVLNSLDQLSQHEWHVRPEWLLLAGVLYVVGLIPMAWFWYRALAALGQPAPWNATLRAYFFGHMGKYVPGKAMAVILRVATVRRWVPSMRLALVSTMLETLTMMAVGAFLAAAMSIFLLRSKPELAGLALVTAIAIALPTLPPIARWLARLGVARMQSAPDDTSTSTDIDANLRGINFQLLMKGWSAALVCWIFLGLSLWATLRAIGVENLSPISDLPALVAAVAIAVVAGFISMLPGGVGVRDLALVQLLAETCGSANALVAAVLIRLVWLVSELATCVILYIVAKFR
jgi:glycosyltransferase 2 family protein